VNQGVRTVIYPVSDLAGAKALFSRLIGAQPTYDSPYYVGFQTGEQQIGLDPSGKQRGMTGATPFWDVDDIKHVIAGLVDAGATLVEAAHDVGGGMLVAMLSDRDGNMIGLRQTPQGA
jgi:predicted enzyme related to lactoylglutathione lyase